jgi:ABC-type nickel/cobalt efflux system permease component RcnA
MLAIEDIGTWIFATQKLLQGDLAGRVERLFESRADFLSGMGVALLLGLVHALTPGHGKSVMFAYFSGRAARPGTGFAIAACAAATHGGLAVLLVLAFGRVLGPFGRPTNATVWLEVISAGLVAAIGAFYLVNFVRRSGRGDGPVHGEAPTRFTLAAAVGMLPCPLTIIVVAAAVSQGAVAGGLALAAAISVGAACTIGAIGFLGMGLRRLGLAATSGTRVLNGLMTGLEALASLVIFAVGVLSLVGALGRVG